MALAILQQHLYLSFIVLLSSDQGKNCGAPGRYAVFAISNCPEISTVGRKLFPEEIVKPKVYPRKFN
jgi:hypothetical protein